MENFGVILAQAGPLIMALALVVAAYVVYRGLKFLAVNVPDKEGVGLHEYATAAVLAVEQLFKDKDGKYKYDEAVKMVLAVYPKADPAQVKVFIESSVKLLGLTETVPAEPVVLPQLTLKQ